MHQPIRLPRILGHHRSAYLRPSALSVSDVLLAASRRSPVIALVAFGRAGSARLNTGTVPWQVTTASRPPRAENAIARTKSRRLVRVAMRAARAGSVAFHTVTWPVPVTLAKMRPSGENAMSFPEVSRPGVDGEILGAFEEAAGATDRGHVDGGDLQIGPGSRSVTQAWPLGPSTARFEKLASTIRSSSALQTYWLGRGRPWRSARYRRLTPTRTRTLRSPGGLPRGLASPHQAAELH